MLCNSPTNVAAREEVPESATFLFAPALKADLFPGIIWGCNVFIKNIFVDPRICDARIIVWSQLAQPLEYLLVTTTHRLQFIWGTGSIYSCGLLTPFCKVRGNVDDRRFVIILLYNAIR